MSELLQELQEVKAEAAAAKEELNYSKELSQKLQEQIQVQNGALRSLWSPLQEVSR